MKIGVLTVPFNNNYGGFLQGYALKKILCELGHEVIFINRRRNPPRFFIYKIRWWMNKHHVFEGKYSKKTRRISIYTDSFKNNYLMPITEEYYSSRGLKRCLKYGIDFVIVGSDQVWRYKYAGDSIDDYYCKFLEGTDIPRISYAASMGTDIMEYPSEKIEICSNLLKSFKAISVREESTANLLKGQFAVKNIEVVLDPTLLLDVECYCELFRGKYEKPSMPYVFSYILDNTEIIKKSVVAFSHNNNLDTLIIRAQTGNIDDIHIIEPVEKWLASLYYADYVITDSFHGAVFSILFNKKFVVYGNKERGLMRLKSLLSHFSLSNRLVFEGMFIDNLLLSSIVWDKVNNIIKDKKEKSISFLIDSIKYNKQ